VQDGLDAGPVVRCSRGCGKCVLGRREDGHAAVAVPRLK
jgi:hypothetical protein